MFNLLLKRFIATILIVSMIISSSGFATLAGSIDDVIATSSEIEKPSSYRNNKSEKDETYATPSEIDDGETYSGNNDGEEEEDESSTTNKEEEATDESSSIVSGTEPTSEGSDTNRPKVARDSNESESSTTDETTNPTETTTSKNIVEEENTASISDTEKNETINKNNEEVLSTNSTVENIIDENNIEKIATASVTDISILGSDNIASLSFIELLDVISPFDIASISTPVTVKDNILFGASPVAPNDIWLGVYPQNDSTGNQLEPIKWRKLSESVAEALYVSDKVLDKKEFHNTYTSITWANSGIRSWLNGDFKDAAFTSDQLNNSSGIIITKTITTTGSADTSDKIFLLSNDEVNNLFSSNNDRKASGTSYNTSLGTWWLRSAGYYTGHASQVNNTGAFNVVGDNVDHDSGIRPALYINLESSLYKSSNNTVTWNHNGGTLKTGSTLWSSMNTYLGGQQLPVANNYTAPTGKYFLGMSVDYPKKLQKYTNIPDDQTENITITALWGDTAGDHVINYDFAGGSCTNWSLLPRNFTPGTAKSLPSRSAMTSYITPPNNRAFLGFRKSGTTNIINEISNLETSDVTLEAVYESPAIFNQGWYNSTTNKSVIQNINVADYRTADDSYWDEIFEMNSTDKTYAYRKGNTLNVYGYGANVKAVGNISEIFKDFTNLQSINLSDVDFSEATNMEGLFEIVLHLQVYNLLLLLTHQMLLICLKCLRIVTILYL